MSPDQEKNCKEKKLDIFYYELYNLESENAFSIDLIVAKEKEKSALEEKFVKATKEFKAVETKIEEYSKGKKGKKLSEEQKKELGLARNQMQGEEFKLNAVKGRLSKLYEEVAEKSKSVRALKKNIIHITNLDLSKVPQLSYIEVNGTKYQAKDNAHVYDENNNMILYIQPNGETNTAKKSA